MATGSQFWDANVWSGIMLIAVILASLLLANVCKRCSRHLRESLVPVSVIAGLILLGLSMLWRSITGDYFFNNVFFTGGSDATGMELLEIITYHGLAIGFIAMTLCKSGKVSGKERSNEVLNTGIITVSTYLLQGIAGMIITILASFVLPDLLKASGLLLAFGYGQGSGQALNYGSIYEAYGFVGGKSFGLTIAAMGFLSASIGGVMYLNYLRRKGALAVQNKRLAGTSEFVEHKDEIPMNDSVDKLTIQVALVALVYAVTYGLMGLLGNLVGPGLRATIYGFNFLIGVLVSVVLKTSLNLLRKWGVMKQEYTSDFLLSRISGFAFDIMIVTGIGAIQIDLIGSYWWVLLLLGIVGAGVTYLYVHFTCYKLFPHYGHEEFMVMFGMLTGTASTGIILLREIDPQFKTPASENLVYQNFPAIVLGFPILLVASYAPISDGNAYRAFGIIVVCFFLLNILLFRQQIFGRKKKSLVHK